MSLEEDAQKEYQRLKQLHRKERGKRRGKVALALGTLGVLTFGLGLGGYEGVQAIRGAIKKHAQETYQEERQQARQDSIDTAIRAEEAKRQVQQPPPAPAYSFLQFDHTYGPIANKIESIFINEHLLAISTERTPEQLDTKNPRSNGSLAAIAPADYETMIYDLKTQTMRTSFISPGIPKIIDSGHALYWIEVPNPFSEIRPKGTTVAKSDRTTFATLGKARLPTSIIGSDISDWTANANSLYCFDDLTGTSYHYQSEPFQLADSSTISSPQDNKVYGEGILLTDDVLALVGDSQRNGNFDFTITSLDEIPQVIHTESFPLWREGNMVATPTLHGNDHIILLKNPEKTEKDHMETKLYAYDQHTGKRLWERSVDVMCRDISLTDDQVFIENATEDYMASKSEANLIDARTGDLIGHIPHSLNSSGIGGNRLFLTDGTYVYVYKLPPGRTHEEASFHTSLQEKASPKAIPDTMAIPVRSLPEVQPTQNRAPPETRTTQTDSDYWKTHPFDMTGRDKDGRLHSWEEVDRYWTNYWRSQKK